ncbi:hypothetical protein CLPU_9c01120 [Gottschalkia purinilytica]|uniref:Uncharacterized protein n=1 Tax=Gottschalkia purinilytica TaxID=1503 RepID=A0A0L0W9U4_GOTPU|nr:hypothetical protein [Gottschalkia purinilytica]KNF08216.1 hypothetical protein CLPU_9c01120 [Gottschalkia purinilytica]
MLYIGVLLIILGVYATLNDVYYLNVLVKEKNIKKKEDFVIDNYYKIKATIGLFSFITGILALVNYFTI